MVKPTGEKPVPLGNGLGGTCMMKFLSPAYAKPARVLQNTPEHELEPELQPRPRVTSGRFRFTFMCGIALVDSGFDKCDVLSHAESPPLSGQHCEERALSATRTTTPTS
jgi:hypothetical protein